MPRLGSRVVSGSLVLLLGVIVPHVGEAQGKMTQAWPCPPEYNNDQQALFSPSFAPGPVYFPTGLGYWVSVLGPDDGYYYFGTRTSTNGVAGNQS